MIFIPSTLTTKELDTWNRLDVITFVEANLEVFALTNDEMQTFRRVAFPGSYVKDLTRDELERSGFGPIKAGLIIVIFSELTQLLRLTSGTKRAADAPLAVEENELIKPIRQRLELALFSAEKIKPCTNDLLRNGIRYCPLPTGQSFLTTSLSSWPSHVQEYYNNLTGKMAYSEDPENDFFNGQVNLLKLHLGDRFNDYFESTTRGHGIEEKQAVAFAMAIAQVAGGKLAYHNRYSGMAKEVCLTGLVVDPAIKELGDAYNRATQYALIPIKGRTEPWAPLNSFRIAYSQHSAGFALLLGETGSTGETEEDVMCKMAVLSLHSWRVYHELTGQNKVILSVYVSKDVSSMHIFYRGLDQQHRMECVLKIEDMFDDKFYVVEFLRRMYQFTAMHVNFVLDGSLKSYKELLSIFPQYGSRNTRTRTSSKTASSGTSPKSTGAKSSSQIAFQTDDISGRGYEVVKLLGHPHVALVCRSRRHFVAKKTRWSRECAIIAFLSSCSSLKHQNHVILAEDMYSLDNDMAVLIMPYYTDLTKLERLSSSAFYDLRFQLIEGVAFMHEQRVVHLDLKPQNIVLEHMNEPHGKLFIIDYDIAKRCTNSQAQCSGIRGTDGWTAPEIKSRDLWYPMPADIWAMTTVILWLEKLTEEYQRGFRFNLDLDLENLPVDPASRPTAADLFDSCRRAQSVPRRP